MLTLERFCVAEEGVFGYLTLPSGETLYTVERAWRENRPSVSCIPCGLYALQRRSSGVVTRSSGGKYTIGWEVTNVVGRSYIMIHPANFPHELAGCIAPGMSYGPLWNAEAKGYANAVKQSAVAFDMLMEELSSRERWELNVRQRLIQFP